MWKIWFRLLVLVAFVVTLVAAIGSFLPRGFSLRQEVDIGAPADRVFEPLNDLHAWSQWSPWRAETLGADKIQVGEPASGKGAKFRWEDPRGPGELRLDEVEPPRQIAFSFSFAQFENLRGDFLLEPTANGTHIVWTCSGRLPPGPFYGYFASIFRGEMESQFQASLQRLKAICESESGTGR